MDLAERRNYAEKFTNVITTVVHNSCNDSYQVVYSVTEFDGKYCLNRYFPIVGDSWEWSQDVRNGTLEECFSMLSDHFKDLYPKEEGDGAVFIH